MSTGTLNIGLIGAGRIGRLHAENLVTRIPSARLRMIADVNEDSARLCAQQLGIPGVDAALDRAMVNFNRVQGPKGGYGYRASGDRYSLSGVGIACELFWTGKRDGKLRDGIDYRTSGFDATTKCVAR